MFARKGILALNFEQHGACSSQAVQEVLVVYFLLVDIIDLVQQYPEPEGVGQ